MQSRAVPRAGVALALVLALSVAALTALLIDQRGPQNPVLKGVPQSAFDDVGYHLLFEPPDKDVAVSKEAAIDMAVGFGFGSGVATEATLGKLVSEGGTKPYDNVVWAVVLDPTTVKGFPPSNPDLYLGIEYELAYFVVFIDANTGEFIEAMSRSSPVYPTPSFPPLTPPPTPSQAELASP